MALAQSYDIDAVLARIEQCVHDFEGALCTGDMRGAHIHADDGLSEVIIYWQLREEGSEEPYCGIAGYNTADRYVSDAAVTFESVYSL